MKKEIPNPYLDGRCFFCGFKNEDGLKLKFYLDEEKGEVSTVYLPSPPFIGQGDILHGGIMMGILDEIMAWTSNATTGEMAVTSNIQVNFLKPVYLGKAVTVTCKVTSNKHPKIRMEAKVMNSEGLVCYKASGTYHILEQNRYKKLIHDR